eukprot:scaffold5127_cov64-Phaeocystis_antarctica.AAC.15
MSLALRTFAASGRASGEYKSIVETNVWLCSHWYFKLAGPWKHVYMYLPRLSGVSSIIRRSMPHCATLPSTRCASSQLKASNSCAMSVYNTSVGNEITSRGS